MTETTATTKAKTTKHAGSSFTLPDYGMPKFEMPKFDLANTEMPEAFREMAEKGVEHTRDAYTKAKVASEEAVDLLENTYEAAAKRATDYNRKLIAIVRFQYPRRLRQRPRAAGCEVPVGIYRAVDRSNAQASRDCVRAE